MNPVIMSKIVLEMHNDYQRIAAEAHRYYNDDYQEAAKRHSDPLDRLLDRLNPIKLIELLHLRPKQEAPCFE